MGDPAQVERLRAAGRAAHAKVVAADRAATEVQQAEDRLRAEVAALQGDLVELSEGGDRERQAHQKVRD